LIPTSRQRLKIDSEVFSFASLPNVIVPMHNEDTLMPVVPKFLFFISAAFRYYGSLVKSKYICDDHNVDLEKSFGEKIEMRKEDL
jgi:hypothetical protein